MRPFIPSMDCSMLKLNVASDEDESTRRHNGEDAARQAAPRTSITRMTVSILIFAHTVRGVGEAGPRDGAGEKEEEL